MCDNGLKVSEWIMDLLTDEQLEAVLDHVSVEQKKQHFRMSTSERVMKLIKGRIDITCADAVHHIVSTTCECALDLLTEPIDTPLVDGETLLMFAARNGHGRACMFLIERGANPDIVGPKGMTPNQYLRSHIEDDFYLNGLNPDSVIKNAAWLLMDIQGIINHH